MFFFAEPRFELGLYTCALVWTGCPSMELLSAWVLCEPWMVYNNYGNSSRLTAHKTFISCYCRTLTSASQWAFGNFSSDEVKCVKNLLFYSQKWWRPKTIKIPLRYLVQIFYFIVLKGVWHEIFDFRKSFVHESVSPIGAIFVKKNRNGPNGISTHGSGINWFMKKIRRRKSLVRLPLKGLSEMK